jgi:pimeloyl-ACP methyl ester carboxylesterase
VPLEALRTISIDGVEGCYTDLGQGPPLVLLISPFARAAMYHPTIDAFQNRFRVIAVEMPGCGCAARLKTAWDFNAYAQWVAAFVQTLDLQDVILVGHSHTGAVALHVGAKHPGRIAALVLADSVGAGGPRSILAVLGGCALCVPMELKFVLRSSLRIGRNLLRHGRNFLIQFWRAVRADIRPQAPQVAQPVLLAWGAMDFVMPLSGAKELASHLLDVELYVSRRGSHDWLIERPDEFSTAVESFAQRDNPRPSPGTPGEGRGEGLPQD